MRRSCFFNKNHLVVFMLLFFMGIIVSGCSLKLKSISEPDPYPVLGAEDIETRIIILEKTAEESSNSSTKASLLFHLSLLYSHHKNPLPDYSLSLERLKEYILLDPEGGSTGFVQYFLTLLEKIEKNKNIHEKLKDSIETLKEENKGLKKRSENLSKENGRMKEIIEELKHLDIRLEEKRRKIEYQYF